MKNFRNWRRNGCRPSRSISACLVLLIFACSLVAAASARAQQQEKKKPKPKPQAPAGRIEVSKDSLKAQAQPAKAAEERLQLPEVLIYGKDATTRVAGKKITISPDNPELISPPSIYDPVAADRIDRGERQNLSSPDSAKFHQGTAYAHAGNFGQFGGGLSWWQASRRADGNVQLNFTRGGGQYLNSQRDDFLALASLAGRNDRGTKWRSTASLATATYGLYGAAQPLQDRELRDFTVASGGDLTIATGTQFSANGELGLLRSRDRLFVHPDSARPRFDADNLRVQLSAALRTTTARGDLFAKVESLHDRVRPALFAENQTTLQTVQAGFDVSAAAWLSVQISAGVNSVKSTGRRENLFRPGVRLVVNPTPKIVARLEYGRGFQYSPWKQRLAANPYLARNAFAGPEKVNWQITGSANWRLGRKVVLLVRFERQQIDNYFYFERDAAGTFSLKSDIVRLGSTMVGVRVALAPGTNLELGFVSSDDAIKRGGRFQNSFDLPYRPETQTPVQLSFAPAGRPWKAAVKFGWVDRRRTSLGSLSELASFSKLDAEAEYRVSAGISLFAQAENVLGDAYQTWQGYRGLGANGTVGLQAKW